MIQIHLKTLNTTGIIFLLYSLTILLRPGHICTVEASQEAPLHRSRPRKPTQDELAKILKKISKMTIKHMILGMSMFLVFSLHANVSSKTSVNSPATVACGHAFADAINAVNSLSLLNFCSLNSIMSNTSLTDEQKWAAVAANGGLSGFYSQMNTAGSVLISNGFFSMSSTDKALVENQTAIDLGIAIANVGCNGYHIAINSCLNQNIVCVSLAIGSAFSGCLPCVAVGLTACSALMLDCSNTAASSNPGCAGQSGSLYPNQNIKPFSYNNCQS
jgi:hypothetical protein